MQKTFDQITKAKTWEEAERLADALAVMADEKGRADIRDLYLKISAASRIARASVGPKDTLRAAAMYNRALGDLRAALMD